MTILSVRLCNYCFYDVILYTKEYNNYIERDICAGCDEYGIDDLFEFSSDANLYFVDNKEFIKRFNLYGKIERRNLFYHREEYKNVYDYEIKFIISTEPQVDTYIDIANGIIREIIFIANSIIEEKKKMRAIKNKFSEMSCKKKQETDTIIQKHSIPKKNQSSITKKDLLDKEIYLLINSRKEEDEDFILVEKNETLA